MISLGIIFAIISFLGWGIADFLAKFIMDRVGALWTLLIMQVVGIVPVVLYAFLFLKIPLLSAEMLGILAISSFLLISAYLFFYKALKHGPVSIVSPIAASASAITVIISVFFFAESLAVSQVIAIVVIISGILLVSINWERWSKPKLASFGVVLAFLTMLGWAFAFPMMKINMSVIGPIFTLLIVRVFSIVFLSIYAGMKKDRPKVERPVWIYLIAIGLIDAAAFLAYYIGMGMDYLSIVSPISTCYPAVTIVLAYIFLRERVQGIQKLGIILILGGLILISMI